MECPLTWTPAPDVPLDMWRAVSDKERRALVLRRGWGIAGVGAVISSYRVELPFKHTRHGAFALKCFRAHARLEWTELRYFQALAAELFRPNRRMMAEISSKQASLLII